MKLIYSLISVGSMAALAGCGELSGPDGGFGGQGPGGVGGSYFGTGGGTWSSGGQPSGSGGALVGSGGASSSGGSTSVSCNYPDWSASQGYAVGAIVRYPGTQDYYQVVNATDPGIDPTISTWYWDPYSCVPTGGSGGSTGTGGSTSNSGALASILSESVFNQMFPGNDRDPIYSYAGLLAAADDYPAFVTSGDTDTRKREIAAFLANVAQETGFLKYTREIAQGEYCEWRNDCPCQAGQKYFGRGAIQLSWNYNYCAASSALSHLGLGDLRANPDLVATTPELAWVTGVWYWMERDGGSGSTPHQAITGGGGFGGTIRAINGSIECGGGWASHAGPVRVQNYQNFCALLGVSPGGNLTC